MKFYTLFILNEQPLNAPHRAQSVDKAGSCLRSDKAQVLEARRESCFGTGGSSLVVMVGGGRVMVLEDETSTKTGHLYYG